MGSQGPYVKWGGPCQGTEALYSAAPRPSPSIHRKPSTAHNHQPEAPAPGASHRPITEPGDAGLTTARSALSRDVPSPNQ